MNAGYQTVKSRLLVVLISTLMIFGNVASPLAGVFNVYAATKGGKITVSKVDDNGNSVKGAQLQLLDSAGNIVEQWTSDGNDKVISNLEYPGNYTVHEVSAPIGYATAQDMSVVLPDVTTEPLTQFGNSDWVGTGSQGGGTSNYSMGYTIQGMPVYCVDRYNRSYGQWNNRVLVSQLSGNEPSSQISNAANIKANKDALIGALLVGYPNDMAGIGAGGGFERTVPCALYALSLYRFFLRFHLLQRMEDLCGRCCLPQVAEERDPESHPVGGRAARRQAYRGSGLSPSGGRRALPAHH